MGILVVVLGVFGMMVYIMSGGILGIISSLINWTIKIISKVVSR